MYAEIAHAVPPAVLRAELAALPACQRLFESGAFVVVWARGEQAPACLRELGRLRERTFRLAGEGTGKPADIDRFDAFYLHLILWDQRAEAIAGAYRMGLADEIVARYGKRGLYTNTLFRYGSAFLEAIHPAIELGRSFVASEYQRDYAPLLMLWRGIGRFIARAPRYAHLFGAVSVSDRYTPASRQLIVECLSALRGDPLLARHVEPRRRLHAVAPASAAAGLTPGEAGVEALSRRIATLEPDHKGIPVLLKQYLKFGGTLLSFSLDDRFANTLDGLALVDLRKTGRRVLERYMGNAGAAGFIDWHDAAARAARSALPAHGTAG